MFCRRMCLLEIHVAMTDCATLLCYVLECLLEINVAMTDCATLLCYVLECLLEINAAMTDCAESEMLSFTYHQILLKHLP